MKNSVILDFLIGLCSDSVVAETGWQRNGLSWRTPDYIPPDKESNAYQAPQTLAVQIGTRKGPGQYHYQYDRIRAMRRLIDSSRP